MIFASPPAAFGFAVHAWRWAADRWMAVLALGLTGVEVLMWLLLWLMFFVG